MWDVSTLTINNPVPAPTDPTFQPDDPVNVHLVTLSVRATLHSSNPMLNGVKGESRNAVHVYAIPIFSPNFPVFLGSSGEGSPKLADLLGDGKREIVLADSSGLVHAIKADGSELAGWPAKVETLPLLDPNGHNIRPSMAAGPRSRARSRPIAHSPIAATAAVGDIDGDGKPEVVVATWFGYVWAFHADGTTVAGFPGRARSRHRADRHRLGPRARRRLLRLAGARRSQRRQASST